MNKYVLGFMFSTNGAVWLIRKNKPEWQRGRLNGIGGKIEENESPADAMKREFYEEAGIKLNDWKHFCTLTDRDSYEVYCYYVYSDETPATMTEEKVTLCYTCSLPIDVIPNVNWLIPMALSFKRGEKANSFVVKEMYKVD